MAVQLTYPGVYIDEFAPGAPIQGVGTSTAAFIGRTTRGPINQPVRITSWNQFLEQFDQEPIPGHFLWYAVRGFFQNGGRTCYIVRASNGQRAAVRLQNGAGIDLYEARARNPGAAPFPVVTVTRTASLAGNVYTPPGAAFSANTLAGARQLQIPRVDAERLKPGDVLLLDPGAAAQEQGTIRRVIPPAPLAADGTLELQQPMAFAHALGTALRLADATPETRVLRLEAPAVPPTTIVRENTLTAGAVFSITQGATTVTQVIETVQAETVDAGGVTYRVRFRAPLGAAIALDTPAIYQSEDFRVDVTVGAGPPRPAPYEYLSSDPEHPRYAPDVLRADPGSIIDLDPVTPPPAGGVIDAVPAGGVTALAGGTNEVPPFSANEYINAINELRNIDDVNLLNCPDAVTLGFGGALTVQQDMITHCEQMTDRFAVLDPCVSTPLSGPNSIEDHRAQVSSIRGYAALYYPWLRVPPHRGRSPILVPPGGHCCGLIADTDVTRGVHYAPANIFVSGVSAIALNGVAGVERRLSNTDHGILHPLGINAIRIPPQGGRPTVMGARTTATDRNWQQINVRRLFLFLEESIAEAFSLPGGPLFKPNNRGLWAQVKRTVTAFLQRVARDGALFDTENSFYVKVDEELNPFESMALGILHLRIGIRPAYAVEYLWVEIGIWDGGSEVREL